VSASVDREFVGLPTLRRYKTRRQLAEFLTARGFPISKSTLDKLAMPSRGEGPPPVGFWGNRALYDPKKALAWAKGRFHTNWRASAGSR
jgi:hypothetical protein